MEPLFIHYSGLGIKPGTKALGLNNKFKAALRGSQTEVKFLIIDEVFVLSSDIWIDIDSRLGETFMMIRVKTFASLSLMIVSNLR